MKCPKCEVKATCIDDMLQVGYVAEIYTCPTCEGEIYVEYSDDTIGKEYIKTLQYKAK